MSYLFDHRHLAEEMEIFIIDEQIGAGLPIWLPNGVAIRDALESFIKKIEHGLGYQRVVSPNIAKAELYEKSGHLAAFKENMFPPLKWPEDKSEFYLKPMNCPHHHKIFASSLRSFRQLPFRVAEYGQVYRFENSGSLSGLSRVRGLCQNDAHIYIDPARAASEIDNVIDLHEYCYKVLNLKGYKYRLSMHDPDKSDYFVGDKIFWIQCENILREALIRKKLPFFEAVGEAAFYGPKIDIQMQIGKSEESISSIQLDFISGERFDLSFVANSGEKVRPWVIHRAPLGSHERFVSMLLEYYDGKLPGWLCPIQIYVIPVSESEHEYAKQIVQEFLRVGIRAKLDENLGSLSKRIRIAHRYRPFSKLIIGKDEVDSENLKLQLRNDVQIVNRSELVSIFEKLLVL